MFLFGSAVDIHRDRHARLVLQHTAGICFPCNMQQGIAQGDQLHMLQELGRLDESFDLHTPSPPHFVLR
jgi:hypothetical protein